MVRLISICLTLMWVAIAATAQDLVPPKRITLGLPPGAASETAHINYALEGSFGSHGDLVHAAPNVTFYEIPISFEGQLADRVLIVAWIPGCEVRTYEVRPRASRDRQLKIECEDLPTVTLTGRIQLFESIAGKPAELVVWYQASWECRFFGWADCWVPEYEITRKKIEPDGTFQLQLPDFSSDPVINSVDLPPGMSGEFRLAVRDPKTWNPIANLGPELPEFRSAGGNLKVVSTYPSDLVFIVNSTIR